MFITIDRNINTSIKKQIYDAITNKILNGEIKSGVKMPSSRQLATQLNVSRNTVTEIYDQLVAESYLITFHGKGTYVANVIKLDSEITQDRKEEKDYSEINNDEISFIAGTPDLSKFPKKIWLNSIKKYFCEENENILDYSGLYGYVPFRKSLGEYLLKHKGIKCSYKQIIVTSGTRGGISLTALFFINKMKKIMLESPVVNFAKDIFMSYGYELIGIGVDENGLKTDVLPDISNSMIYTTPSHQFPMGGTLPIDRRQKLVEFAKKNGNYILEDDYDSEFRYKGAPVNSLYQLAPDMVIHFGTFSKTIAPSLRLGYMVLPESVLSSFEKYFESVYESPYITGQMAMTNLLKTGFYEKYLHKMRRIYKSKMSFLIKVLKNEFKDTISINGKNSGLHVAVKFKNIQFRLRDKKIFHKYGLDLDFSIDYMVEYEEYCNTVILGFGHLTETEILKGIKRFKRALLKINN